MAEFCLDCHNKQHGTNFSMGEVTTSYTICEGCGVEKECVITERAPGPIAAYQRRQRLKEAKELAECTSGLYIPKDTLLRRWRRRYGKPRPFVRLPRVSFRLKNRWLLRRYKKYYPDLLTDYAYLQATVDKGFAHLDEFRHTFSCEEIDNVYNLLRHARRETIRLDENGLPHGWLDL